MIPPEGASELKRRIVTAALVLGVIFLAGSAGFYGLGQMYLLRNAWSFGDCAYFTVITITTVGFAELPHLSQVPGGHLFTSVILLSGLGVALYFVSSLTTYFVEGEFFKVRSRRKMQRAIDNLSDHIIVCGVGTTGIHVVEELLATQWPVVAVDLSMPHLERARELGHGLLTLEGDATEDATLEAAGIRRARGIVAALTDDKANLFIVVTARGLNPNLRIIAKGVDTKAAAKLRKAGADSVVNPAFIGGVRMVSEMIRPQVVEFLDLMLRDRDKNLRIEEVTVPAGSWMVGKPISEAQIRRHTNLLVVAVREAGGQFVYNPGPETEIIAGMALIVLGETDSVQKLRAGITAGFQGQDLPLKDT